MYTSHNFKKPPFRFPSPGDSRSSWSSGNNCYRKPQPWYPTANPSLRHSKTATYGESSNQSGPVYKRPFSSNSFYNKFAQVRSSSTPNFGNRKPLYYRPPAKPNSNYRPEQGARAAPSCGRGVSSSKEFVQMATACVFRRAQQNRECCAPVVASDEHPTKSGLADFTEPLSQSPAKRTGLNKQQAELEYGPYVLPITINGVHTMEYEIVVRPLLWLTNPSLTPYLLE